MSARTGDNGALLRTEGWDLTAQPSATPDRHSLVFRATWHDEQELMHQVRFPVEVDTEQWEAFIVRQAEALGFKVTPTSDFPLPTSPGGAR